VRTKGLIDTSRPHCPMVTVPSVAMTSEAAPGATRAGAGPQQRHVHSGARRVLGPGRRALHTIVRRVRVPADEVSADARSPRRRTICKRPARPRPPRPARRRGRGQFIVTNLPPTTPPATCKPSRPGFAAGRTSRSTSGKPSSALRCAGSIRRPRPQRSVDVRGAARRAHFGYLAVESLTGLDTASGRTCAARLRFQVLRVPARVIRYARLTLRLPPAGFPRRLHPPTTDWIVTG
jgi:hypothetical protein